MGLFINDGYTIDGQVVAKDKMPGIKFRYRPALPEAAHEYRYQFNAARNGKERLAAETKLLVDHLVSWDASTDGKAVPVTAEWLNRLHESVRSVLLEQVLWGIEKHQADEKN